MPALPGGELELACGRLFDEVPCYISVQDREFRVIVANRKLIADFGDPTGAQCWAAYKGRTEACPECPVARTFEDGREHSSEETIFDRRGLPHSVLVNTRPVRDRSGALVAAMELFTDITRQKELEHRLHESVTRFHELFDLAPCYITVQDRGFRLLDVNERCAASFGDWIGRHCYELLKKRSAPCSPCPAALTFADGAVHSSEEVLIDNSGTRTCVVVHTAPLRDAAGQIRAVMEVADDITEIRALQDKLASLGGLVGGIAHSIKNVLEGLRGGVYIVKLGFRDNNQEDLRTGWDMVERNVARISAMIMDMLYCAREPSPRRVSVDLAAVAGEVAELYARRASEYSVDLRTELAPAVINAEPKDIHALMANLVTNAIDACLSDQGDDKQYRVRLRVRSAPPDAVIEVEDNGAGMDEETQARLFTHLFSSKGAFGTGLGLLVTSKVVREHGGTIAVQSAPGAGSTFTVRLPLEANG